MAFSGLAPGSTRWICWASMATAERVSRWLVMMTCSTLVESVSGAVAVGAATASAA